MPTELGITLVRGYQEIDPDLCLPGVRSHIEKQIDLIATGKADKTAVVRYALDQVCDCCFSLFPPIALCLAGLRHVVTMKQRCCQSTTLSPHRSPARVLSGSGAGPAPLSAAAVQAEVLVLCP